MKEEYDALVKSRMWSLVPRASNTNVVDCKWVYRLKHDKNGSITRYKARFVSKRFSATTRILLYLHCTIEHGMLVRRSFGSTLQAFTNVLWKCNPDTSLEAFLDADWAGDSDDRWSTRRFAIYLGLNLISWTARKQCTVSRSSTKAEYKALVDTVVELT
uniref:Reverse transcriptase Ty1/copia-type domain-containing protein n=1 Tax=Tanacetum cinerariifolium TaxID=118510 RepID=A0A699HJR4_TANCI|nr:hypothetical protein [Tanacetum cinerariifolium]